MKNLLKFGGISFIISGTLFLIVAILNFIIGSPPSTGQQISSWATSNALSIELMDEFLFFATLFLIPAIFALYHNLSGTANNRAVAGCGIIAVVLPVLFVLQIFLGRYVYPVYGIYISNPVIEEFITTFYYGGLHAVAIAFAVATIILSTAMKKIYGSAIAYLGIVTGIMDLLSAYPWLFGPIAVLVFEIFFALWFLVVGLKMLKLTNVDLLNSEQFWRAQIT